MPKIESWDHLPEAVQQHLIDRMRDRAISIADLNRLRLWVESKPEVPEGDWYKDFRSSKVWSRIVSENLPVTRSTSEGQTPLTGEKSSREFAGQPPHSVIPTTPYDARNGASTRGGRSAPHYPTG
jgi:hypothetical protein